MEKKDLLLEIKPKYKILYVITKHFVDLIIVLVVLTYIGSKPNMLVSTILATIIMAFACFIYMALKRKHCNRIYFYRFYTDKLIYRDSFFKKEPFEIKYNTIKEIRYSQGFLQTVFKLGEIVIVTKDKNILKRVIFLKLIPNVEKNYKRIEEVLDKRMI